MAMACGLITTGQSASHAVTTAPRTPIAIPMAPPVRDSAAASIRN